MKLAIMQPYLFPYLGYYQLIAAVDRFVIYDDVAYMKQGWVNRNRVLVNGQAHLFSVPLHAASSFDAIRDTRINPLEYPRWRDRFLKTVGQAYGKAPGYEATAGMLSEVLAGNPGTIGELATRSLLAVCRVLGVATSVELSSTVYGNNHLRGVDRVLDICAREKATTYVNSIGGKELYFPGPFLERGLALRFLRSRLPEYRQFRSGFVPGLSIVDVLMFNTVEVAREMLKEYELIE